MVFLFGLATVLATLLGGLFALRRQDKLHLILGFSAGAVIGVAFFDLLPEALELAGKQYSQNTVTTLMAVGFLLFMLLSRTYLSHSDAHSHEHEAHEGEAKAGGLGALSLSIHSLLDGVGIGLAFQVSTEVGLIVAIAVLAHDFSDGINTVSYILNHEGDVKRARFWLWIDALAPFLGVLLTSFFSLPEAQLGLLLAVFCGFFLYIGASDLLPESLHRHPKMATSLMTVIGVLVIFIAINLAQL